MSQHQTCKKCLREQRFEFNIEDEIWYKLPEKWHHSALCIECFLEELQAVAPYQKFDMLDFYHLSIVGTEPDSDPDDSKRDYNSYCKKCSYDINRWYRIRLHSREGRVHFMQHEECYLKEAKAMIRGKHWEGKNRCVKLEGDA